MMRRLLPLLCLLLVVASAPAQGAGTVQAFPEIDGEVHVALVSGNFLFIGGEFTIDRNDGGQIRNLAQIDLREGSVNFIWGGIGTNGPVHALALSVNANVLYVGGEFTTIHGAATPRTNLAAIGALSGVPASGWRADVDGPVYALARSQNGLELYVGGEFTTIGGEPRANIARIAIINGVARPWLPEADGIVRVLAVDDAHGQVFAGGDFTLIGEGLFNGLAAIGVTSGRARSWSPALETGARVRSLVLDDNTLYVGGVFDYQDGADTRTAVAAFDVTASTIEPADWVPPAIDGEVGALAIDRNGGRLFVGGDFEIAGGDGPLRLAALRLHPLEDPLDPAADDRVQPWAPDTALIGGRVNALALGSTQAFLYAGGAGGEPGEAIPGIAGYPVAVPVTLIDPAGGGQQMLLEIELTCEARSDADCERICYAVDEPGPLDPATDCVAGDSVTIPWPEGAAVTTLRFFSEDADGHREPLRTEAYAIDNLAPVTTADPLPLAGNAWFGFADLEPVTLTCDDDFIEFGCTTYYTVDGSDPRDGAAAVYSGPIALGEPAQGTVDIIELQFFSVDDAGNEEAVQSLEYRVDLAPPLVTVSQPSGTYLAPLTLELTCDDGEGSGCAAIYFTTDDSDPAVDADGNPVGVTTLYEGALSLTSATVLKVLAIDEAGNASRQTLGIYALSQPGQETRAGVGALNGPLLIGLLALALLSCRRRFSAGSGASR